MKIFTLILVLFFFFNSLLLAQIKITDGVDPTVNQNSILELESTDKGLLISRVQIDDVNSVSPLTAPVPEGMLVYSDGGTVTDGFYFWNGTNWTPFLSGETGMSYWTRTGNDITNNNTENVYVGTSTDYTQFEADGSMVLNGASTVYNDLLIYASGTKLNSTNYPAWADYRGGAVLSFSKTQNNQLYFNVQLPHNYKEGSDIEFHIHTTYLDANAGNSIWKLTYTWANMGDAFPTETTVTKTITASGVANTQNIVEITPLISGTGKKISSILICSLTRLGADAADTYDNEIYFISADFHYEINSIGSRTPTIK